ncbi:hypothetical protein ACWDA7_46875 [Streptomyces sp. NPDC001156]
MKIFLVPAYRIGIAGQCLVACLQLAGPGELGQVVQQGHPKWSGIGIPRKDVIDHHGSRRIGQDGGYESDERRGRGEDTALVQHRGIQITDGAALCLGIILDQSQKLPGRVHRPPVGVVEVVPIDLHNRVCKGSTARACSP